MRIQKFLLLWAVCFAISLPSAPAAEDAPKGTKDTIQAFEVWGKIREGNAMPDLDKIQEAARKSPMNNFLCAAASSGEAQKLETLLRDGVSPDSTDALGVSALSHAVLGGHKD